MPTTKLKEPQLQLTISLAEVLQLQTENAALKKQVGELEAKCELLENQLRDLTDPAKQADAKAYRRRMGYE